MHEVVVIGSGTSGIFAALKLAAQGQEVAVVTAGPPSALMCRGVAFVGDDFPDDARFAEVFAEVFPVLDATAGRFMGFDGSVVEAARAFTGAADIGAVDGREVLVMDVQGLPGPDADLLAFMIGRIADCKVRGTRLKIQYAADDFALSPVAWARRFDEKRGRAELISHVLRRLIDEPADVVLLPPILGISFNRHLLDILDESAPGHVMEMLGGPGWPPGLRIASALDAALADSPVERIHGRVVEAEIGDDRRIRGIVTAAGDEIRAERFVLATGGIIGGGVCVDGTVREACLGLPVFTHGHPVATAIGPAGVDPAHLFAHDARGPHPVASAGIGVDERFQPLDRDGRIVHPNLWGCGSVVGVAGDREIMLDPGRSAWSGWRAAERMI